MSLQVTGWNCSCLVGNMQVYDDQPLQHRETESACVAESLGTHLCTWHSDTKPEKTAVWSCVYPRAAVALSELLLSCKCHSFLSERNRLLTSTYTSAFLWCSHDLQAGTEWAPMHTPSGSCWWLQFVVLISKRDGGCKYPPASPAKQSVREAKQTADLLKYSLKSWAANTYPARIGHR